MLIMWSCIFHLCLSSTQVALLWGESVLNRIHVYILTESNSSFIGGSLSQFRIWQKYPYLLPCLVTAFVCLISFCCTVALLQEVARFTTIPQTDCSDSPTDASKPTNLQYLSPHVTFHVTNIAISRITRRFGGDTFASPILAPGQQRSDPPAPHRPPQLRHLHLSRTLPHRYILPLPPPSHRRRRALSQPDLHRVDTGDSGHPHWSRSSCVLLQGV